MPLLPYLTFAFFLLSPLTFSLCPPGRIRPPFCFPCPRGTFRASNTTCYPCPPGTFRRFFAAEVISQCIPCPTNTFSKEGSSSCLPCPSKSLSLPGSSHCSTCPPGFRLRTFARGKGSCIPCPPHTFSGNSSNAICYPCPDGSHAPFGGAKSCIPCPPGTYGLATTPQLAHLKLTLPGRTHGCAVCPPGTIAPKASSKFCHACPVGTLAHNNRKRCVSCPEGTFSSRIPSKKCRPCPKGTTSKGTRPARCRSVRLGCPWNTFEGKGGECQMCLPGEWLDVAERICKRCPPGEVSLGGIATKCTKCDTGKEPMLGGGRFQAAICVCKQGTVENGLGRCVKCPKGSFWYPTENSWWGRGKTPDGYPSGGGRPVEAGWIGGAFCRKCPKGVYQDTEGQISCKKCPKGSFTLQYGSAKCLKCPEGSGNPEIGIGRSGTECIDWETNCIAGFKRELSEGDNNGSRIYRCAPKKCTMQGTFLDDVSGRCMACPRGMRFDRGKGQCLLCREGTVGLGGVREECVKCGQNMEYRSLENGEGVCDCRLGWGREFEGCRKCRYGEESRIMGDGVRRCSKCGPGKWGDGSGFCKKCNRDEFTQPGRFGCSKCPGRSRREVCILRKEVNRCSARHVYIRGREDWLKTLDQNNLQLVY